MATAETERTVRFELPDAGADPGPDVEIDGDVDRSEPGGPMGTGAGAPGRSEPIEVGPGRPRRRFGRADVVALVVRPLAVFFGGTVLAWALARSVGSGVTRPVGPGADPVPGYGSWLGHLFPLRPPVGKAVWTSLQLAVAGLVVGAVLALLLGGALRVRRLQRPATALGRWLLALAPPVTALAGLYWLILRFDTGFTLGSASLLHRPGPALDRLVVPALVVGLAVAPSLAGALAPRWAGMEPAGRPVLAAPLASRAAPYERWHLGFPAGSLVAAMTSCELLYGRAGLFALVPQAVTRGDLRTALDALAVIILAGALVAVVVDLIGLAARPWPGRARDEQPAVPGASLRTRPRRPTERELRWRTVALVALAAVGIVGWVVGRHPAARADQVLVGPLSGVHLLGTDRLGRDLGLLAASGLGQVLLTAMVAALEAVAVAYALVLVQRNLRAIGPVLPGAVVDALWWPVPLLLVIAYPAVARSSAGLLSPPMVSLLAVGLIPTALRLLGREQVGTDRGGRIRLAGVWLLVAAMAAVAALVAGLAGVDRPATPSLGYQLGSAVTGLEGDPWPAVIPGVAVLAVLGALQGLGGALVALGWYRTSNDSPPGAAGHEEIDLRDRGGDDVDLFEAIGGIHDDGESENWVSSPILAPARMQALSAPTPAAPVAPAVSVPPAPPVGLVAAPVGGDGGSPWARPDGLASDAPDPDALANAVAATDERWDGDGDPDDLVDEWDDEDEDDPHDALAADEWDDEDDPHDALTADEWDDEDHDTGAGDAWDDEGADSAQAWAVGAHQGVLADPAPDDDVWAGVEDHDPTYDPAGDLLWAEAEAGHPGRDTAPAPPAPSAPPAGAASDPVLPPATGGGLLSPNYSLQPGLPPVDLDSTMQLPVVRVRRRADGEERDAGGDGPPADPPPPGR